MNKKFNGTTVETNGVRSIAGGGTGSTTAADALTALGAVAKAGDTMTGKLVVAADATASKLNIGDALAGTSPTTTANGDLWITNTNRVAYRSGGSSYTIPALTTGNSFNQPQIISTVNATTALRVTQAGVGEAFRVEYNSLGSIPFVISNRGRVGIGVTPDATVALSLDTTGIKFGDGTTQTTAAGASAGVTSVSATSPITSTGGTTPVISTSIATNKLLGRSTAGTGVAEEISIGTGLSLTAGTLSNNGVLSDATAAQGGTQLLNMVQITQTAYDAIVTPTANTLYIIVG